MSVLIKGMEMPFTCLTCDFHKCAGGVGDFCSLTKRRQFRFKNRPKDCPLIPVPPHGRLIDADALHKLFEDQWHYLQVLDWNENPTAEANQSGINWCINTMHDDAPTIIPEEEGET